MSSRHEFSNHTWIFCPKRGIEAIASTRPIRQASTVFGSWRVVPLTGKLYSLKVQRCPSELPSAWHHDAGL